MLHMETDNTYPRMKQKLNIQITAHVILRDR